jgi:hypothetical protein
MDLSPTRIGFRQARRRSVRLQQFLLGGDPTGRSSVWSPRSAPILPGIELDIVSSIRFTGEAP